MEHKFVKSNEINGHTIIECESCGFNHIFPYPSEDEIEIFYKHQYWNNENKGLYQPLKEFTEENLTKLKNDALENKEFNRIFDTAEKLLQGKKDKSFLDLACGTKLLQLVFAENNYKTSFVEPSELANNLLNKLGLTGFFTNFEKLDISQLDTYDFINMGNVLEHLQNPFEILEIAKNLLNTDGVIRITVPNDINTTWDAYVNGCNGEPCYFSYPDHINYFSIKSLLNLVSQFGFEPVKEEGDFPVNLLLLTGFDYKKSEEKRDKVGEIIRNFESAFLKSNNKEELFRLYDAIAKAGFSRNYTVYLKKMGS